MVKTCNPTLWESEAEGSQARVLLRQFSEILSNYNDDDDDNNNSVRDIPQCRGPGFSLQYHDNKKQNKMKNNVCKFRKQHQKCKKTTHRTGEDIYKSFISRETCVIYRIYKELFDLTI